MVCVHGLMGTSEDFRPFIDEWSPHFQLVLVDLGTEGSQDSEVIAREWGFEDPEGQDSLAAYLQTHFPDRRIHFTGISFGGKFLFHMARRYPRLFHSAVITDVGPAPLVDSPMYRFLKSTVESIPLAAPWETLREELERKFTDRRLRILVKSQLVYDEARGMGRWKPGLSFLGTARDRAPDPSLWDEVRRIQTHIVLLKAGHLSAMGPGELDALSSMKSVSVVDFPDSDHFLHLSEPERFTAQVLGLLV